MLCNLQEAGAKANPNIRAKNFYRCGESVRCSRRAERGGEADESVPPDNQKVTGRRYSALCRSR
jgi:hypothetical protein